MKTKTTKSIALLLAVVCSFSVLFSVPVNAAQWTLQTATALEEGNDNFAYGLSDYDHDGNIDLFCIKKANTGSRRTEIHILSGATNYTSFMLHTATILGQAGNAFQFAVGDVNNDGYTDVAAIMVHGTGSRRTEIHVLNGATNFQSYLLQAALPIEEAKDNYSFSLNDFDGDGKLDLFCVKFNNTSSKRVELHILNGKTNFQSFLKKTTTALGQTNSRTFKFCIGEYSGDATPDIYALKVDKTSSNTTELHILDGNNPYSFLLQTATKLEKGKSNFEFLLGDHTKNSALDLFAIKKCSTGSKRTEVHILTVDGAKSQGVKQSTIWPVAGDNYIDQCNWKNYKTRSDYHSGTDISAVKGTDVYATYDGVVDTAVSLKNSYGKHVVVKCNVNGKTVYIYYAHLSVISVSKGDVIKAGQKIGEVGNTGNSSGDHLHYEVRNVYKHYGNKSNPTLNPYLYLPNK